MIETGTVQVPQEYFLKMAKADYDDYQRALAREFFQNSSDAGATWIKVEVNADQREIVVSDNGCGMDYDTIKNKLLVLGGSKKRTGNTGAFGKAKEVLFFSWEEYSIRTRNLLVKGHGADYTIEKVADYFIGTECKIKVWENENISSLKSAFFSVSDKFEVDSQVYVDSTKVIPSLLRGVKLKSLDWADIYFSKEEESSNYIQVRLNGQWMFQQWLYGQNIDYTIIVEIKGDSVDVLNSNRDSLKREYRDSLSKLIEEIVQGRRNFLKPPKTMVREKYKGKGSVTVSMEAIKKALGDIAYSSNANQILNAFPPDVMLSVLTASRIEAYVKSDRNFDVLDHCAFIGYEPDFVVVYEESDDKKDMFKIKNFLKSKRAKVLAFAWTETVRQVLLDIGKCLSYTAGFNFSIDQTASFERIDGENYFYINPDKLLHEIDEEVRPDWFRSRDFFREDLVQKALHEVTHLRIDYHNEDFVLSMEAARAQTWKSTSLYKKIVTEAFATA